MAKRHQVTVPPVVKLGAHEYQVALVHGLSTRGRAVGASSAPLGKIQIDPDRTSTQRLQTLLHELVHQGHFVFGAGSREPPAAQCDSFAEAVTQLLTGVMELDFDWSNLPLEESS
mgnify:CR=1 FL=1